MQELIDLIRYMIHAQYIEHAEEWFVKITNPLYTAVVFAIFGFSSMLALGITANVNGYKSINIAFWILSMIIIILLLFYGRYIFRLGAAGAAIGVAKTGISGLDKGTDLLKQYFNFGLTMIMVVTATFGALACFNFSWFSAGACVLGSTLIAASNLQKKA